MVAVGRAPALLASMLALAALTLLLLTSYESFPGAEMLRGPFPTPSHDSKRPSSHHHACTTSLAPLRDVFASRWGIPLQTSLVRAGTGARVRRAMERLWKERKITVGILGGSITYGHGLQPEDKRYSQLIEEGLRVAFPDAEIVVKNGAVPATGTDYFSACYKHHVPEDADLFILEGAVNDLMVEANTEGSIHQDVITDTETLVRELLKGGAAVMMLSTWGMTNGYMNGADHHATVAEYYDVPRISTRAALYQYIQAHHDAAAEIFVPGDMGHYNPHGHRFMADAILDHLLEQAFDGHPAFEKIVWHNKHYWAAEEIGARITFTDVEVHGGFLGLYYLRSVSMGLGNLRCWVDGNEGASKLLVGQWGYVSVGSVGAVATGLAPGKHNVTCEVDQTTQAIPNEEAEGSLHKTRIIAVIAS
ncbi:uncharacterized protein CcaverHIS019_0605570 [Cutaneotrichosporon cavernicola]|uniref:SGNH hydrolase-type esterase domain-containing protein n=1 Tax=Cutaneotrichosporon cavernicola TaxID=279322 RepID=A0AA48QY89_9TREE|nr:uncharacterized protein CcaverHIS019_0605570 [Cutaneotrichosporon cavernicola]BEI94098.1 hypothetical protein CcaverHIS019_0605570 [Cutaneotrichosporon cavernicola]BEJ01877.1 hypothetical protein CcaverHIS631_0605590 [Cutaneotrichosporon cavernicola]BEJ09642.1 hypothetical protein CcaverHIS641_0605570 [Cutaneotrichosporon cavernicola]